MRSIITVLLILCVCSAYKQKYQRCHNFYMHTYIYTYIHTFIHTYMLTYTHTYIHTRAMRSSIIMPLILCLCTCMCSAYKQKYTRFHNLYLAATGNTPKAPVVGRNASKSSRYIFTRTIDFSRNLQSQLDTVLTVCNK